VEQYSKLDIKIYNYRKTTVIDGDGRTRRVKTLCIHVNDPGQRMTNDETIFAIHALFRAHGIYFNIERSTETITPMTCEWDEARMYTIYAAGRYKNGGYLSRLRGVSLRRGNHRFQLSERRELVGTYIHRSIRGVGLSLPGCNMRQQRRRRRRRLRQTTRRPYMFNCDRIYNITVCTRVMYRDKERYP